MPSALRTVRRATFEDLDAVLDKRPMLDDRLVHSLALVDIQPSPRNPRQQLGDVGELADSLRAHGLLQPIVVRRHGAGYELIAGHRRYQAAHHLGWTAIAAVVRDETDEQAYILTLVENLQREDLSPKEEAAALEVLVRERNWSVRQVGEAIKRSHMYVSKRLRVFEDAALAAPVLAGKLPVSTAEELLRVGEPAARGKLVERAQAERWGQAEARQAVRQWKVTFHESSEDARSARVLKLVGELYEVLAAGPMADLSREARAAAQTLSARIRADVGGQAPT